MKNPFNESMPPSQQYRRLRDFLTGAEHEAVKTQRLDAVRKSRGSSQFDDDTAKTQRLDAVRKSRGSPQAGDAVKMPVARAVKRPEGKLTPLNRHTGQQRRVRPESHKQVWKPGTFGFNNDGGVDDDVGDVDLATIPLMVLRGISEQKGLPQTASKSEISNAAGSAAYVGVGNIAGSVIKYGSNIVIQRGFGAGAYGLYTLSLSVVGLVGSIFNLGLDDAMLRYVSIYQAKRQKGLLRGLTIFCTTVVGIFGILGALLVLYYAPFLAAVKHSPEIIPVLQMMSPIVPLLGLQLIWTNGLQGFKEFRWRVLVQRILIPVTLILLLLGAIIFFHTLDAIVVATVINAAIGTALSLYFFFCRLKGVMEPGPEKYEMRDWIGFAAPNFLTSIVDTVLQSVDTILLAYFAIPNAAIGLYSAAIKISGNIVIPQYSLNAMFAPTIAELHSRGEHQKLEAMFKVVTKWAITFSLPIFLIATLFSTSLLSISGEGFVSAWPLVIAFSVGTMVNVSTGSVGYMLLMTGHTKISFLNSLAAVIVNIIAACILTPHYGAMGVAIATGLATCGVNIMRLLQVCILLKMQPYSWNVLKPIGAGAISVGLTGGLLYLLSLAHLSVQIYKFHMSFELILVPVFIAIYFGLLALFKVSPEDKIVLDSLRRKFRHRKKMKK